MGRAMGWVLSVGLACATLTIQSEASALLFESGGDSTSTALIGGQDEFTYFYPYRTSYTEVDYKFEDDPLNAFLHETYDVPLEVKRPNVRRSMLMPRMHFVDKMRESANSVL